mmetsp:Transcript_15111/g.26650  ORF Transcript_15111/g.26650 Transcript_15111/m.26650 type:complete len:144 (-) Transcript_15111:694-1125(-)
MPDRTRCWQLKICRDLANGTGGITALNPSVPLTLLHRSRGSYKPAQDLFQLASEEQSTSDWMRRDSNSTSAFSCSIVVPCPSQSFRNSCISVVTISGWMAPELGFDADEDEAADPDATDGMLTVCFLNNFGNSPKESSASFCA